jgi:predicted Zn-dependent protease
LAAQSEPDVVSVQEARHPLTGSSLRSVIRAQEHLRSGQHERGMQELRDVMKDPAAMPYAITILGGEHLRGGQLDIALDELEQAIRLLPRSTTYSNLAYALYLKRQTERGLELVRKAIQMDGGQPKTRLVLGMLLLQQGTHDAEAIQNLQAAARENPDAHRILAWHYDGAGKALEAEKERRAYAVTSMGLLAGK